MFAILKPVLYNSPGILTENKKRPTTSPKIEHAEFLLNNGGPKLGNAPGFQQHPIFLITLLLACTVFFPSCRGDPSSISSPPPPASNTQTSAITPIGALATCLTINSPLLVKLADGNYKLVDEIDNCGGKDAGPPPKTNQNKTHNTQYNTNHIGAHRHPVNTKTR